MADANIRAVITAEDRASSVVSNFGSSFTKMAGAVATGMAIFETLKTVTFGVVGVFTDSIEAFEEQENATIRLQAALKNVHSATNTNITDLVKQATALERVTRFSDEQILSAQGILATYQLNQDAIEKLTPSILDMAEGIAKVDGAMPDLESNAKMVARALGGEDTDSFVSALTRGGIALTNHQQEILKTGTFQERFAAITEIMKDNVGGLAEAMGQTASGRMLQFQNAINNLQEQLGAALWTALAPFIQKLTEWASSDQARAVMQQIADKIVEVSKVFYAFVRDNWPQIKSTLETLARVSWDIATAMATIFGWVENLRGANWNGLAQAMLGPFYPVARLFEYVLGLLGQMSSKVSQQQAQSISGSINRATGFSLPHFAEGGIVPGPTNSPTLAVVHGGEEVIPVGGKRGQTTYNITINAGAFTGSQIEARKFAEWTVEQIKDVAGKKSMTGAQMLGS